MKRSVKIAHYLAAAALGAVACSQPRGYTPPQGGTSGTAGSADAAGRAGASGGSGQPAAGTGGTMQPAAGGSAGTSPQTSGAGGARNSGGFQGGTSVGGSGGTGNFGGARVGTSAGGIGGGGGAGAGPIGQAGMGVAISGGGQGGTPPLIGSGGMGGSSLSAGGTNGAGCHPTCSAMDYCNARTCTSRLTEFGISRAGAIPANITAGSDGTIWFADGQFIAKITVTGSIYEFDSIDDSEGVPGTTGVVYGLTLGPDGNVWFTSVASNGNAYISSIDQAGRQTHYRYSQSAPQPSGIANGPDGNIWFAERVSSPSSAPGVIYVCSPDGIINTRKLPSSMEIGDLIVGPDGNIWFSNPGNVGQPLFQMTASGIVTSYPLPSDAGADQLAGGSDGSIWFTEFAGASVGKLTLQDVASEVPILTKTATTRSITFRKADNSIWVTEDPAAVLARVGQNGVLTEFPVSASAGGITSGPDGNIWFTEPSLGRVARLVPP